MRLRSHEPQWGPALTCRGAKAAIVQAIAAAVFLAGCAGRPEIIQDREAPEFGHSATLTPLLPPLDGSGLSSDDRGAPARRIRVGTSVEGRPLVVEVFSAGPVTALVIGGIHGDEGAGVGVARRLAEFLGRSPQAARGKAVAILAEANPDGAARHTRTNANGVDLNRNFPARNWRAGRKDRSDYGGPAPASEPETQAILRAAETLQPDRLFSLHGTASLKPCNNYDGPAAGFAQLMAARNGYPVLASIGHPTPGSLGNWAGVDRGIPIITLELPEGRAAMECWEQNRPALVEALSADGPATSHP